MSEGAPKRIIDAKFRGDKRFLSISGMAGAHVTAEKLAKAKREEQEMRELRNEAFDTIAAERAEEERIAAEKLEEERLRGTNEDIIPLDTYE